MKWQEIFDKIIADPRYAQGVTYGKPRRGHDEGTVAAHIIELDATLEKFTNPPVSLTEEEYWKLKILIHVHDTFKKWAKRDSPIEDVNSHATLARLFLFEFTNDQDMLAMCQWHDENFALWKQFKKQGYYDPKRFAERVFQIEDMELFVIFTIIDGYTASKMKLAAEREQPEKSRWFVEEVRKFSAVPRAFRALETLGL